MEISHRHFFCLYSLKVERNTVNILVDVQFILKALEKGFLKKKVCHRVLVFWIAPP